MALRERLELLTRRKVLSSHRTERVPLFFFFLIFSPVPFGERGRGAGTRRCQWVGQSSEGQSVASGPGTGGTGTKVGRGQGNIRVT